MLHEYFDDPWIYRVYERDAFLASEDGFHFSGFLRNIGFPRLNGGVDDWADYDFADFKGYHARLALLGVLSAPFDVEYRIWGSGLIEIYRENLSGRTLSSLGPGRCEIELEYLEKLVETGGMGYGQGPLYWQKRHHVTIRYIDIPMRNGGAETTRILSYCSKVG